MIGSPTAYLLYHVIGARSSFNKLQSDLMSSSFARELRHKTVQARKWASLVDTLVLRLRISRNRFAWENYPIIESKKYEGIKIKVNLLHLKCVFPCSREASVLIYGHLGGF